METLGLEKPTVKLDTQLEHAGIGNYDSELSLLASQVEFYKNEHKALRSELTDLIEENRNLSEQLRTALASNVANDYTHGGRFKEAEMIANLKQQFALVVQEKDVAVEMWQSTLKEVTILEEELKHYQDSIGSNLAQSQLDKVKGQYSEAITLLEFKLEWTKAELSKERSLHDDFTAQLEKLKLEYETSCKLIQAQKDQLQEALKMQASAEERTAAVECKLQSAVEETSNLNSSRQELEAALARCHNSITVLKHKYDEACSKVEEAVSLLECACVERDRAVQAEAGAREESIKSQAALSQLIEDAGNKVTEEVKLIKIRYNEQIEKVLFDMKKLEDKLADKCSQLEKVMKDYSATQDELDRVSRLEVESSQSGGALLERKIQSLFQELSDLHHRNFQLTKENDCLTLQLNNIKNRYEQDLERSVEECRLLEQQLLETTALYEEAAGRVQLLTAQLQVLHQDVEQQEFEKYTQERDELVSRLQEVQVKSVETANELHHHLESQQEIKNKWKKTIKIVAHEFETKLKELRNETTVLRDENERLKEELKVLHVEMSVYQQIGNV